MENLKELWIKRSVRFLAIGILSSVANVVLIVAIINIFNLVFNWDSSLERAIANLIATEIGLIIAFLAYRLIVWEVKEWEWRKILITELPVYHVSMGVAISTRVFLLFPLLDGWGLPPALSTSICIALSSLFTYAINEKITFSTSKIDY